MPYWGALQPHAACHTVATRNNAAREGMCLDKLSCHQVLTVPHRHTCERKPYASRIGMSSMSGFPPIRDAQPHNRTRGPASTEEGRVAAILDELAHLYPDARCALNFRTPFELLVATVLSAQSTDKRVNQVTACLFQRYNTPEAFAALRPEELAEHIKELGLFRNKALNLVAAARTLLEQYGGEVPADREALEQLPGVGRKTANVVLSPGAVVAGPSLADPPWPADLPCSPARVPPLSPGTLLRLLRRPASGRPPPPEPGASPHEGDSPAWRAVTAPCAAAHR